MSIFTYIEKNINKCLLFIKNNILLLGTLITLFICIYLYITITNYGKYTSDNITSKHNYIIIKDTIINNTKTAILYDTLHNISILINPVKYNDIYTFNRIISQLKIIKYREQAHNKAIDYFTINLFYFIIVQSIFMVIVVLLGIIISRKGWGDSSTKLLATFLICCGFLLLFKILPISMKLEENITNNKNNYLIYNNIENYVLTYLSSDKVIDNFTKRLDMILKRFNTISFDLQQVSITDVQDQLNQINELNQDDNIKDDYVKDKTTNKNTSYKNEASNIKYNLFRDSIPKIDSIK